LTLFRPIKFLRLQLQNNSASGVDITSEAYLCTLLQNLKNFGCLTLGTTYW